MSLPIELQFKNDVKSLGVDETTLDSIMKIHYEKPNLAPYECKRLFNIRKNEEKLQSLNLTNIKSSLTPTVSKPLKRKNWTTKLKSATTLEPSRKSARIAGIEPVKYSNSEQYFNPTIDEFPKHRQRKPNLKLDEIADIKSDSATPILDAMRRENVNFPLNDQCHNNERISLSQLSDELKTLRIDENQNAKICKTRLSCLAVHGGEKLIVAGGSKWGEIGLFMPGEKKTIVRLEPHANIVAGCEFSGNRLFTSSYDSSVRMFDAESLQFDEVYSGISTETFFRSINVISENEVMVSSSDGQVIKIDIRENKKIAAYPNKVDVSEYGSLWNLHQNKFDLNYFLSTSNNAKVAVWDQRNTKCPVDIDTSHKSTVSSAKFDPLIGKKIVTVGYDDKLCILEFADKAKLRQIAHLKHFNNTGRWLTKFQANWHPLSDELFVIGSMRKPRCIEILNTKGDLVETLTDDNFINSVQSLTEFHPVQNILVCGNGSGYCNIFRKSS